MKNDLFELSYNETSNLINKHEVLLKLQEKGYKVEPIYDRHISKYSEVLISVNEMLCYLLPLDNTPRILNDTILTDTDFVIATFKSGKTLNYYIIPSDDVKENKSSYPLEYNFYKDRWDFLNL